MQQSKVDKEMDEALEESIRHWQRLAANPGCEGHGPGSCALCQLVIARHRGLECEYCPVMNTTGLRGCFGTPYTSYGIAMARKDREGAYQHASREVEFLESLRRT
jgi:hypothetical protein